MIRFNSWSTSFIDCSIPDTISVITSFEITTQPKLIRMKARYFIGIKNNPIIAFPENKKQLINSFPNFKDQITNFIKSNDLDFDNETDLSKVALFLGTL
jgi:hypothetical protein